MAKNRKELKISLQIKLMQVIALIKEIIVHNKKMNNNRSKNKSSST